MAKHNNPTITEDCVRIFNTKQGEQVGSIVDDVITPAIIINRRPDVVRRATAINSGSTTIYTTPSDKDFYLCTAQLSTIKDATATSTEATIISTFDGSARVILSIMGLTLTAQSGQTSITFNPPLKIDRNVGIAVQNTTSTGNVSTGAAITGYTVETVKN